MEPLGGWVLGNASSPGLAVDEDQEEGQDGKAWMISKAAEGGEEKEGAQAEFVEGATAAVQAGKKEEEELRGGGEEDEEEEEKESSIGAMGPDPINDEIQEHNSTATTGVQEQDEQQQESVPASIHSLQPANRPNPGHHARFTLLQLQELENLFQENHYPSLRAIRDLARWMGVTEASVKDWFKMKRGMHRRSMRTLKPVCASPDTPSTSS